MVWIKNVRSDLVLPAKISGNLQGVSGQVVFGLWGEGGP